MERVNNWLVGIFVSDDDEDTYYRAVVLGLLVAVGELVGGAFMGSVALISDGAYALIVALSISAGVETMRITKKWPALDGGVKKFCASLGFVLMIFGAALILMMAWDRVLAGSSFRISGWSVAIMGLFAWALTHIQHMVIEPLEFFGGTSDVARRVSKMYMLSDERWQSPAIVAIGVIAGIANMFELSPVFPVALDVIMSLLIAIYMAWGAFAIGKAGRLF